MKKICIIVASIGKNLDLAHEIAEVLKEKNIETTLLNLIELNLPLYSSLAETKYSASELIMPHMSHFSADAFVFVAPEYNGGPPPAFSNFLAWVSRSTKHWRDTFNGRHAMLASFSAGNGVQTILIMRTQLAHIGMNVLGRSLQSTLTRPHTRQEIIDTCEALVRA